VVYPLTGEQRVIFYFESNQQKRNLLLKKLKLIAVKLVSTGKIKAGRGVHKPVKKRVLMFAKLGAEKVSSTESQRI
jgi:hypothetical protein